MSDTVIRVENLGKRYLLKHQQQGRSRYVALRDVIADGVKSMGQRILHPNQHQPSQTREEFWALKDVSFEVKQGEVVGIIGRNGAGKSTLLKLLSRITEPTTGRISIKGRVGSLLEVGTGFHPELTGRENIYLNGAILGMSKAEIRRKFDEIVDFAEIEKFLDTPVKHYSSGMYVRLAFAVAAHLEPEILVVDEVLAVGDAAFQKKCLGKMGSVAKVEGRTILFVSHDMPAIESLCQKAYLIETGCVKMEGNPGEVIANYLAKANQTSGSQGEVCLLEHPGRSFYSREPALRRTWLIDQYGHQTKMVMMGESVTFFFEFCCSQAINNPGFGFGVSDYTGRRIFSLNNYMIPSEKNSFKNLKKGIASLLIPSIPLMPGIYLVSVSVVENQVEWVDFVENCLEFEVYPADVFGSGKIPESSHGCIFLAGDLSVQAMT
ncbi:ABC transporter ATP-binding protein [Trichothermofontia sichuanensis B231]|uniref:ABC transporter ATP-binding protein n=1 Tax=Trichothermofontia sichuanensis TaxID=3045816 RepID=UPI00224797F1|nr:ABC transporter ATP-binding protein [Trichothermofontia sichuanensis]UZQ55236.1 ABC transporter ATP-binding protein [Trichothermofontia sichuanensis B231]